MADEKKLPEILLIEDAEIFAQAIQMMLKNKANITIVETLGDAQKALENKRFDGVITDNRYPEIARGVVEESGIKFVKWLRKGTTENKDAPLLFQTMDRGEAILTEAVRAGADLAISKTDDKKLVGFVDEIAAGNFKSKGRYTGLQ